MLRMTVGMVAAGARGERLLAQASKQYVLDDKTGEGWLAVANSVFGYVEDGNDRFQVHARWGDAWGGPYGGRYAGSDSRSG
jgi:hypothetical protein